MIVIKHRKSSDVVLLRIDASKLDGHDLTGAYLLGAEMAGQRARWVILREANLRKADLRAADLREADLRGAVLRGADLRGADLSRASLVDADLRAADLRRADLRGADLSRAMLFEADLTDVRCDSRTQWPAGDGWGVVARPAVHQESVLQRAGTNSYYVSARRRALQWGVASASYRHHAVRMSTGVAGRMAGAALAALVLVAAASSLELVHGSRAKGHLNGAPTMATRAPMEPFEVLPEPARAPVLPRRQIVRVQPRHPLVVRKPDSPRSSPRRNVRVARARVAGVRIARSDHPRSDRMASLARDHQPVIERRYGRDGAAGERTGNVRLASYTASRPRPNAATRVIVVDVPSPVEQPTVERVAVVPVRPQPRWEPRAGKVPEAWGNQDFHYGSGYDIYTMHLGRRQE